METTIHSSLLHIKDIIKQVSSETVEARKQIYENFEDLSIYIKRKNKEFTEESAIKSKGSDRPGSISSLSERVNQNPFYQDQEIKKLLTFKVKRENKLEKSDFMIDDVLNKAAILEFAGISLGKLEWFKLKESMKKLITKNVVSLRFWGKIFGKDSDYYIVQSKYKYDVNNITKYISGMESEPKYLEGANQYIFYVTSNLLGEWTELPETTIEQMRICRLFKYRFTGDLKARVNSFINFPGKEAHLLKCTILRIMSATSIVPDGYLEVKNIENSSEVYGLDLTDKVTQVKEDFQIPQTNEEMASLEKWIHEYSFIYPNGRIMHIDQGEGTPALVPRLQSISNDKPISETTPLWNIKEIGDKLQYTTLTGTNISYSCLLISNSNWPGAKTVYRLGEFFNIYIGDGVRLNGTLFFPLSPDTVQNDPEGLPEYKEPNPDKEPEIIESDSDREEEPKEMD